MSKKKLKQQIRLIKKIHKKLSRNIPKQLKKMHRLIQNSNALLLNLHDDHITAMEGTKLILSQHERIINKLNTLEEDHERLYTGVHHIEHDLAQVKERVGSSNHQKHQLK